MRCRMSLPTRAWLEGARLLWSATVAIPDLCRTFHLLHSACRRVRTPSWPLKARVWLQPLCATLTVNINCTCQMQPDAHVPARTRSCEHRYSVASAHVLKALIAYGRHRCRADLRNTCRETRRLALHASGPLVVARNPPGRRSAKPSTVELLNVTDTAGDAHWRCALPVTVRSHRIARTSQPGRKIRMEQALRSRCISYTIKGLC